MPHFIIECSENVIEQNNAVEIMRVVYEAAEKTGLFAENDVKVRIDPYRYYKLGVDKINFVHVFANIMEGRNTEQKADLSRKIIESLNALLPDLSILSINVRDFEKATYFNKLMLEN